MFTFVVRERRPARLQCFIHVLAGGDDLCTPLVHVRRGHRAANDLDMCICGLHRVPMADEAHLFRTHLTAPRLSTHPNRAAPRPLGCEACMMRAPSAILQSFQ